jgi:rubrerythrin
MPTPDQAEVRKLATVEEFAQALEWAIQEEQKSLHVYLQLVRVAEDKDARMVLERIVREETNHVRALSSLGEEEINEALVEERRFH